VNGRLSEAQVLALYANQAHRLNWYFGGSQQPLYYYLPAGVQQVAPDTFIVTQQIERFVIRDVFAQSSYPFSRFTRAEFRGYFFARPFTLALRGEVLGRFGRDADLFQQFLGSTELIRGYTAGSVINHECISSATQNSCPELDQLIGSSLAVVNAELRFPLTR